MSEITGILLCAGDSQRMGFHKLLHRLPNGKTPMAMSFEALVHGGITRLIIMTNDATHAHAEQLAKSAGIPVLLCAGGSTRQESVYLGLKNASDGIVVIHDAARCLTLPHLVQACIDSAHMYGSGVAAIPIRDTVLHVLENGDRIVPLPRDELLRMQTPQAFAYAAIRAAYDWAGAGHVEATDDSTLFAAHGNAVRFVRGHINNRKLTTQDDLVWLEEHLCAAAAGLKAHGDLRVGYGEDVHLLVEGRALVLGGVVVPFEKGLLGHSDADVLVHALMDALLGAAGLGDIGQHFPDSDAQYEGISSMLLLERVCHLIQAARYGISNVDITVVAQKPRLAKYFSAMRTMLADALQLPLDHVNLKATTTEGVGPEGRGECMRASAIALLYPL